MCEGDACRDAKRLGNDSDSTQINGNIYKYISLSMIFFSLPFPSPRPPVSLSLLSLPLVYIQHMYICRLQELLVECVLPTRPAHTARRLSTQHGGGLIIHAAHGVQVRTRAARAVGRVSYIPQGRCVLYMHSIRVSRLAISSSNINIIYQVL